MRTVTNCLGAKSKIIGLDFWAPWPLRTDDSSHFWQYTLLLIMASTSSSCRVGLCRLPQFLQVVMTWPGDGASTSSAVGPISARNVYVYLSRAAVAAAPLPCVPRDTLRVLFTAFCLVIPGSRGEVRHSSSYRAWTSQFPSLFLWTSRMRAAYLGRSNLCATGRKGLPTPSDPTN